MDFLNLGEENFTHSLLEEEGFNIDVYKHNDSELQFLVRYNKNNDNVLEFKILDGEKVLGTGYLNETNKEQWVKNFIYEGKFHVWLSNKRMIFQ